MKDLFYSNAVIIGRNLLQRNKMYFLHQIAAYICRNLKFNMWWRK